MQNTQLKDETALIKAAQADPEGFAVLYDHYVQRVYRYFYQRTNNIHDAEDLTAQTFLTALEALPRYRRDGHFAAWLFTIARNKIVDHYRRIPGLPLDNAALPVEFYDPGSTTENSQQREDLLGLIQALTDDERELLRLRYVAELSFAEIGRVIQKNEDAAKKMLYRLLARLKGQLEAENE